MKKKPVNQNDILYMTHEDLMATKRILDVLLKVLERSDILEDALYHANMFYGEVLTALKGVE